MSLPSNRTRAGAEVFADPDVHVTLMVQGADSGDIVIRSPASGSGGSSALYQDRVGDSARRVSERVGREKSRRLCADDPLAALCLVIGTWSSPQHSRVQAPKKNPKSHDLFRREIPQTYHRARARSVRLSQDPRRGASGEGRNEESGFVGGRCLRISCWWVPTLVSVGPVLPVFGAWASAVGSGGGFGGRLAVTAV